jgi:hypothetical protein
MPYVSFVATSRNDNHGGNLSERMNAFVNGLSQQCSKHGLDAELVLVEWNPPPDKPGLREAIQWPEAKSCSMRIILVPHDVHSRLKHSEQLPLFQMIAKNVGIRRCKGDFIVATNVDILFSDELMQFLASRQLKADRMYRVDRYDVPLPAGESIEVQLEFCRKNVVRIYQREMIRNVASGSDHSLYPPLSLRGQIHEWKQDHGFADVTSFSRLHTAACGDFTLLSRDNWFALRGYAELQLYSFHIDSLFCHAAYHSGAHEVALPDPMRIYHIEHESGSGWTPEDQDKLDRRLDRLEIPQLSHHQFAEWAIQMRREHKPIFFNSENWGFSDCEFEEIVVNS